MIEHFNIPSLIRERSGQKRFHVAAEKHVRIEFRNMSEGQVMGPFSHRGDIVLTCYAGAFELETGANPVKLAELDQAIVSNGSPLTLLCASSGTVQLIWTAP